MSQLPTGAIRRRVTGTDFDRFRYEKALARSGFLAIAGIDEAGRGACAGPLVVAAAILDANSRRTRNALSELNDSKQLAPKARDRVFDQIHTVARATAVIVIEPTEIDSIGLHTANLTGMRRALAALPSAADYALTDGFAVPGLPVPNLGVWKGDEVCGCVSAAGVLAKVTRDRIMYELDEFYPQYGFAEHKGYVTASHRATLRQHGPSPVHRWSFAPVRRAARGTGLESEPRHEQKREGVA